MNENKRERVDLSQPLTKCPLNAGHFSECICDPYAAHTQTKQHSVRLIHCTHGLPYFNVYLLAKHSSNLRGDVLSKEICPPSTPALEPSGNCITIRNKDISSIDTPHCQSSRFHRSALTAIMADKHSTPSSRARSSPQIVLAPAYELFICGNSATQTLVLGDAAYYFIL